jgi:hypothetical protein
MKQISVWKTIAGVLLLTALCACGRTGDPGPPGGSSPDFVTVAVDGGQAVNFTETVDGGAHYGYDPYVATIYDSTKNQMYLYVLADAAGGAYEHRVNILINGSQPGEYAIAGGSNVYYTPAGGAYSASAAYPPSQGTITVTRFDDPDGLVQGSYDVIAVAADGATTARLTGSFSVRRN